VAEDPALETLILPFSSGNIAWPADAAGLFLRARFGPALRQWPPRQLVCEQTFRPFADDLTDAGYRICEPTDQRFQRVLVLPPRQRAESRALLAQALRRTQAGGVVVASQDNNEGARSTEADLERLAGNVQSLSKNKCRVFWATIDQDAGNSPIVVEWSALDAPRSIADGRFLSRPGLFAWDRVDRASALLATHLPSGLSGRAADLGAGYGYLSSELLARNPGIVALDVYEAEARALAMARVNLAPASDRVGIDFHWHDVTTGLLARYDVIVSNPPFHQGRADQPDLGREFIVAAARALNPGGSFWLVANRHLPYEAVLGEQFSSVRALAMQDGFKVIHAVKAPA
jgi:16S rRNA (guanine1207-N2)-methyltransferase